MEYVLKRYEWFKEVLKRMSAFEQGVHGELRYNHNDKIYMILNRKNDHRMVLSVQVIGHDTNDEIFRSVFYYMNDESIFANIYWLTPDDCRFTYSKRCNNKILLKDIKFNDENENISTSVVLDYPLREEQIFQQLTFFNIPEEEYIERYVQTSEEILQALPDISTIAFTAGYTTPEINETNYKNMVQSVMDCMRHLELEEQMRIEKRDNYEA